MTTDRQLAANRQNAQSSTGPRTIQGNAISSRNNTHHGLRATTPVIPRLESPAAWEQHRAATIDTLAPETALEETLAERVALILWRLHRVTRYEHDVTTNARRYAAADLSESPAGVVVFGPRINLDDAGRHHLISNPIDAPVHPGSLLSDSGAAPPCAASAPRCALSDPECTTPEPR